MTEMNEPKETALILPFGKHKGERIDEVMHTDPGWVEWVMAQPWFRDRHPTLVQLVVNSGALADADTPEHNKLQNLILEPEMCAAAYRAVVGDAVITKHLRRWLERRHSYYDQGCCGARVGDDPCLNRNGGRCPYRPFYHEGVEAARLAAVAPYKAQIAEAEEAHKASDEAYSRARGAYWQLQSGGGLPLEPPAMIKAEAARKHTRAAAAATLTAAFDKGESAACAKIEALLASGVEHAALFAKIAEGAEIEVGGWDVMLPAPGNQDLPAVAIELKPSLGDDYPSVLRKMKARRRDSAALIVDRFAAEGATWDQVVRVFKASGFVVKTLAEVRALAMMTVPAG
jgi:hypothetical protein